MKFLTILLDDTSVSFCHVDNPYTERKLIPIDILKKGIMFAMKENLSVQIVYPNYDLPDEYLKVIDSIDHTNIVHSSHSLSADIVVIDEFDKLETYVRQADLDSIYVLRYAKKDLFASEAIIREAIKVLNRINIVIKDVESFSDLDINDYRKFLDDVAITVSQEFAKGHNPQINVLTDRLFLENPNHCNAGVENITLSPNGCFYPCPAFYYDEYSSKGQILSVGNIDDGLAIKNPQLYKLDFAPICRICDAYHCRRCVWLNKQLTREINTPSRQQCIIAHLERNAAKTMNIPEVYNISYIPEIDYLDPFDNLIKNK